eukprot:PhF_6_TR15949/c0_g1_i1/m.24810
MNLLKVLDDFIGVPWTDSITQLYELDDVYETHRKHKAMTESCLVLCITPSSTILPMDVMMNEIIGYAMNDNCCEGDTTFTLKCRNGIKLQELSIPLSKYCTGRDLKRIALTMTEYVFPNAEDETTFRHMRVLYVSKGNSRNALPVLDLYDSASVEDCNSQSSIFFVYWITSNPCELTLKLSPVFLKLVDSGKMMSWNAPHDSTVADMKEYVAKKEGYPLHWVIGMIEGATMCDTMYLADCGVQSTSTINILFRSPLQSTTHLHFRFRDPLSISPVFPSSITYDDSLKVDGLTLHDDFGPLEVKGKTTLMNNVILEFSRSVVNPMFYAMPTQKDASHKYCETWNVNLQVTHQGVRYSIPYSCFHGEVTRHTLLYSILSTINDYLHSKHPHVLGGSGVVTPLMLRLVRKGRGGEGCVYDDTITGDASLVVADAPNDFQLEVLPYEVRCLDEGVALMPSTPLRHRVLGMVCVVKARGVYVVGRPVQNKVPEDRTIPP